MLKFIDYDVSISYLPKNPEIPEWGATEETVFSTMISHDKEGRNPVDIWKDMKSRKSEEELKDFGGKFLEKLAGWGHVSAFYQPNFGLNYSLPRYATMFFCSFDHPKYLQQSHRYTEINTFIEPNEELRELIPKQYGLYKEMIDSGIKKEDARYILPLSTAAVHLHQNTNFVGLANIYRVIESENSMIPGLITEVVNEALSELNREEPILFRKKLIDIFNSSGRGYPVANMFSKPNKWINEISGSENVIKFSRKIDEELVREAKKVDDHALTFLSLTNRKDFVEGYIAPMSLSAWHQFMRNDTVKQSVESIYDSIKRKDFVLPESIEGTKYEEEFIDLFNESIEFYNKISSMYGEADSVGVVPHSLKTYVAFDFDGYNSLVGFMRDRTSRAAQWEIRNIAQEVKNLIEKENPEYAKFIG